MAYGKKYGRGEMYAYSSKGSAGDGYMATKEKSYKGSGANVKESRLEKKKGYRGGKGKGGGYGK